MKSEITHRGGATTEDSYDGLPIHAAKGVHGAIEGLLRARLPAAASVADIGAGSGALSQRLFDAGFKVSAFDMERNDWQAAEVECHPCNANESLDAIAPYGPFDAICAVEIIEHLENPSRFLRELVALGRERRAWLVITTPNPLDTFSAIAMLRRGIFNWFSPQHYAGGGHISILPYWLIDEHLKHLGVTGQQWQFLAPYCHPKWAMRLIYRALSFIRAMVSPGGRHPYFEGATALVIVRL